MEVPENMTTLTTRIVRSALPLALLLGPVAIGCSSDGDQAATDDPVPGTSVTTDTGGGRLNGGDAGPTPIVDDYIGLTPAEAEALAEEKGVIYRVGRVDDEVFALTLDFVTSRITVEIDDGVVTVATVG
ncbi:MAG: hypothetical protein ACR2QE_07725 [Acidimicrobiales bacterium]